MGEMIALTGCKGGCGVTALISAMVSSPLSQRRRGQLDLGQAWMQASHMTQRLRS